MGMFSRLLLIIWLMGGTAGSIYLLSRRFLQMGIRMVHLHNQTCLEDAVWWPSLMMALGCISCIIGLLGAACKVRPMQWLFNFLLNLGVLFVIVIMVWRFLMFGWLRKPTPMSFDEVYRNDSPLGEEYKPMLTDIMAADHVWPKVENCLTELQFCDEVTAPQKLLGEDDWKIEDYYEYFKEGCCVPPQRCARNLVTFKGLGEGDCTKWANATITKPTHIKCYNCDSCKAARMATYQTNQDQVRMYSVVYAIFLFVASLFVSFGAFE